MNAEERAALVQGLDDVLAGTIDLPSLLEAAREGTVPETIRPATSELGWTAVGLPESAGGLGLTVADLAAMSVVCGRRLLPPPMRDEALVLAPLLERAETTASSAWLEGLLAGTTSGGGAALPFPCGADQPDSTGEWFMSLAPGAAVAFVLGAEHSIVIDLAGPGVTVEALAGTDISSGQSRVVVTDKGATTRVDETGDLYRAWFVCLLADCLGTAHAALAMSVPFAAEREQFGRPIARFQAVSHRLADMRVAVELAASGLARVIHLTETGSDEAESALVALCHTVPALAREVCESSIQVHGGTGFTWEYGLHLYYRRVLQAQAALGGAVATARRVGRHYLDAYEGVSVSGGPS